MIKAHGVTVRYPDVVAVDGVDLTVDEGEIVGVIGPNGAGKTTLLECVEGLRRPDAGTVAVHGIDPHRDRAAMAAVAGVQLQHSMYPPRASVDDICRLFAGFYRSPEDYRALLKQFGLADQRRQQIVKLSGGQQQRLSLALALLGKPQVVFLDELTTGLDPVARRAIWEDLRERNNEGLTVLLTSHHMEEVEYLCDRVVILVKGQIVAQGTPAELVGLQHDRMVLEGAAAWHDQIAALPGVRVVRMGSRLIVQAGAGERLDAFLAGKQISARTLPPTLEDVYLTLTGEQTHVQ